MSDITEVEDTDLFSSEILQPNNQNYSRIEMMQLDPTSVELTQALSVPENRMKESKNSQHFVQLGTLEVQSNVEIVDNNSENGNFLDIDNNHSLEMDIKVQTIENKYVNICANLLEQTEQAPKQSEDENCFVLDPIVKTSEGQCANDNRNTSFEESNHSEGNKNLALFQNSSIRDEPQTDESHISSPCENCIICKQNPSDQELNQSDGNKNLVLFQNSNIRDVPQTGKSHVSSSCKNYNPCKKNTSYQESNHQQDGNKNLVLFQNANIGDVPQTGESHISSCENENTNYQESNHQQCENENLTLIQNTSIPNGKRPRPSSLIIPSTNKIQSRNKIIPSRPMLTRVYPDCPMLTFICVNISGTESKAQESLVFLEIMKRIEKWFAKIDEINQYNTARFQALLDKIADLKRLEPLVKDKQVMLAIGKDLSLLEMQSEEDSDFEMSTYSSLSSHCEHILRLLTFYERYLKSAYERHNRLRTRYLDCSLQIARYPIEEKLFENREKMMNIINQSTQLMNNMSLKLEETDNYTDDLSFKCRSIVNLFFRDCEVMFSP